MHLYDDGAGFLSQTVLLPYGATFRERLRCILLCDTGTRTWPVFRRGGHEGQGTPCKTSSSLMPKDGSSCDKWDVIHVEYPNVGPCHIYIFLTYMFGGCTQGISKLIASSCPSRIKAINKRTRRGTSVRFRHLPGDATRVSQSNAH